MERYRILLVDDEAEIRQGIARKIDWEASGFEVVGEAENGEEALERAETLEPDVVLTDIRMPYMDGLVLTERLRQSRPSVKVVIFSGYDDFEYAKQAIKLGVAEYILKPVNAEELTAILARLKEGLDQEIEQKRNVSLLREHYRRSLPLLREQFLNDLIGGRAVVGEIENHLYEYDIPIANAKKWVAAVFDVELPRQMSLALHQEKELIPLSVMEMAREKLGEYCRSVIFRAVAGAGGGITVLAAIDEDNSQTGLIAVLGDVCREARRVLEVTVTIGIGGKCTELENIGTSYEEALDALGYRTLAGGGGTIYINDMEAGRRGTLALDTKDEAVLIGAVKFGPEQKIRDALEQIAGRMDGAKVHFRQHQSYMLAVVNALVQLMQQQSLNMDEMFGGEHGYAGIFEALPSLTGAKEFSAWILPVALKMHEALGRERDDTTKQAVREAKTYIQEHFANPDLSVEVMCRHLHMSPAYFSTIFKRETGQTYSAYLTQVRLDKAVELLNKTDDKTYVIAAKVGYPEQNYFSYVFKKRFGVSPTKFRGQK